MQGIIKIDTTQESVTNGQLDYNGDLEKRWWGVFEPSLVNNTVVNISGRTYLNEGTNERVLPRMPTMEGCKWLKSSVGLEGTVHKSDSVYMVDVI